jgi:peptide/nickel transport system permease protein
MAVDSAVARPTGKQIEAIPLRAPSWLERTVGPDMYRILRGLFTNPLSIVGMVVITFFFLVGIFAPVLAPPTGRDAYIIPRDGFSPIPTQPGTEWRIRPPPVPAWYKLVTGRQEWVHIFGTASGGWDIFYGIVASCGALGRRCSQAC